MPQPLRSRYLYACRYLLVLVCVFIDIYYIHEVKFPDDCPYLKDMLAYVTIYIYDTDTCLSYGGPEL